jgi:serine protease Do
MIDHRFRFFLVAGVFAVACLMGVSPSYAVDAKPNETFADMTARVQNSVVTVAAAVVDSRRAVAKHSGGSEGRGSNSFDDLTPMPQKRRSREPAHQFSSIGSGFIIDPAGLIVTNNHVIEGGNAIYVILSDGSELKVDKVIGRDPKTDLTVLKVTPKPSKPLQAISFGASSRMRVGDWVVAIGNPFGLNGTVTAGIISGIGRDINAGPYDDFLQTDASINRGNSGGPLFNARGEVIGINTAIFSPSGGSIGLGFAIPSDTAKRIVEQLRQYGETRWGWIGVRLQTPSDDFAEGLHLASAQGALIARVDKGGPAEAAGLREGDLVLSFGGADVRHARQLPRYVAQSPVGEDTDVVILRKGERKTVRVRIGQLDEHAGAFAPLVRAKRQKLGKMSFEPLSDGNRQLCSFAPDAEGAVVATAPASAFSNASLKPGDLVIEAAHQRVRNPEELEARLSELRGASRKEALLTVLDREGGVRFASLSLGDE